MTFDRAAAEQWLGVRSGPASALRDALAELDRLQGACSRELFEMVCEERDMALHDLAEERKRANVSMATIDSANAVLDAAQVAQCSTLGSRVEILVQERDRMLAVERCKWPTDAMDIQSMYISGWNDALDAIARARSGS